MSLNEEVVLIVDDDFIILEILTQQLESFGITQILTAESAEAALEIFDSGALVSVLLTDLSMPGMDGPRFMRELANRLCTARVILVSGARHALIQSIVELGKAHGLNMGGFLHKPVSPQNLRALLDKQQLPQRPVPALETKPIATYSREQLARALAAKEIHPWYQPKVLAGSLRIVGVEALARWRAPDSRLVSPAIFVPAIEQHGLANELFFCMLEQVLAQLGQWRAQGYVLTAAVNLSMDCTQLLSLPDEIAQRLESAGIAAEQLIIEITESRLMSDRAKSMETITRLALMGLRLSIDDFGTGYSSLRQLAELPFNELKIDASFVQHASTDLKAKTILQTTVLFGRSLGMDVIAEGVERFSQLEQLRHFATDSVQGYLIAKPAPAMVFLNWMKQWRPGLVNRPTCDRPPCLMVVDDSAAMRALAAQTMRVRMPNTEILTAADGAEALALAAKHAIDFTTLDFHMPGIDGLELLHSLRDLLPAARHCMLTAGLDEDVARRAVALGALYCPKPLTPAQADRMVAYFNRP